MSELVLVGGAPFDRAGRKVSAATRALALAILCWAPIALLARGDVALGVWSDAALYARAWIAVPLLIVAERMIAERLRELAGEFQRSRLVEDADAPRLDGAIETTRRLAGSSVAEAMLAAGAYAIAFARLVRHVAPVATWEHPGLPASAALSAAGWWYALFTLPLFFFLVLRWLWRIALWTWFLARTSRLGLRLSPIHPDGAGGLGFLSQAQAVLAVVMLPLASVFAGNWRNAIAHEHASIASFEKALVALVALELIVFVGPLFFFAGRMIRLKQRGILELGGLGARYARSFERKWLRADADDVLGTPDLQSLADFGHVFEGVIKLKPIPLERTLVAVLALAILLPVVPLLGSLVSLGPIVKRVLAAAFM